MKIVADAHIPFVADIFSELGDVDLISGHQISPKSVLAADLLIVRTMTQVNEHLLGKSAVRFVGSATAGLDHVDQDFLKERGIHFASAPGANADSVIEYVFAALAELSIRKQEPFTVKTIGIVGCGHVGGLLAERCRELGMQVIENDPPRAETESGFADLTDLLRESDIVSIHTPLSWDGPHATCGLIGEAQLSDMKKSCWLLQSSRGGVCDERALVRARANLEIDALVLDVWENEPRPSLEHINRADIATGHIAGYSIDAKRRGVEMVRDAAVRALGLQEVEGKLSLSLPERKVVPSDLSLEMAIRHLYDIRKDDLRFRQDMKGLNRSEAFHQYRAHYPRRRSFGTNWDYLSNPNERS